MSPVVVFLADRALSDGVELLFPLLGQLPVGGLRAFQLALEAIHLPLVAFAIDDELLLPLLGTEFDLFGFGLRAGQLPSGAAQLGLQLSQLRLPLIDPAAEPVPVGLHGHQLILQASRLLPGRAQLFLHAALRLFGDPNLFFQMLALEL